MGRNEWPVFYKENLKIGNPQNPVAICTLWTKRETIAGGINPEKYSVCGNLYTVQGINPMMKNILSNPCIRDIILCGADLMKSGEALLSFINAGMDGKRQIAGSYGYIDADISDGLIEIFRKSVRIIDMRGKEADIPKLVDSLQRPVTPFMEPVFIETSMETAPSMESAEIGYKITGRNLKETWMGMLDIIMKFGSDRPTEHNVMQRGLINLVAVMENDSGLGEIDTSNYYKTFFSKEVPAGVQYTYGNRLYAYRLESGAAFDQIENVVKRLRQTPHSRRALVCLWDVDRDSDAKNPDPPCITQIIFGIRKNRLHQTVVARSHDIFGAWLYNIEALRTMQKEIAAKLGVEVGCLTTISVDAHIYENNWEEAKKILDKHYHGIVAFEPDKNGYFVIDIKDGEIVVEHRVNDGRKSNYTFRGRKAQPLYRQILHENLITKFDHAAYIGHELARAEICLKENKTFVQDEA
ncbi:MAG: DUF4346 domain-containing protein [Candidatus Aenigmarchaeota archaeon]|nr:DUF4346 domain-containing protein [Candidatus Aenigmarchaeota archaeon]